MVLAELSQMVLVEREDMLIHFNNDNDVFLAQLGKYLQTRFLKPESQLLFPVVGVIAFSALKRNTSFKIPNGFNKNASQKYTYT